MSLESMKKFLKHLKTDENLRVKINNVKNREEKIKLISEAGFDFTTEEVFSVRKSLSEEELEILCHSISWQSIIWSMKERLAYDKSQTFSVESI